MGNYGQSLEFYGNHAIDFANNDYETLVNMTIPKLQEIPIPDEIYIIENEEFRLRFPGQPFGDMFLTDTWNHFNPINMPYFDKRVVTFGPMGMRIIFTPHYIRLPSVLYEPLEWYSAENKKEVNALRNYYKTVIDQFGGSYALYMTERTSDKFYQKEIPFFGISEDTLEQQLISHFGKSKKTLFDYQNGKYPKYYIDRFGDIM
jgi:hypothetical protein